MTNLQNFAQAGRCLPGDNQSMSKQITHTIRVEFGDCDPARIVWFPNFFRWIDAASRNFFVQCGVPSWTETEKSMGVIGTPLVDTHSRFLRTATYGDTLDIQVTIPEWREKSFVQRYRIMRGDELIMECDEVRIFAGRRADNPEAIRALPIPAAIRSLCE
jgi:4-hydroxybenzoyl-CoA thioesterase